MKSKIINYTFLFFFSFIFIFFLQIINNSINLDYHWNFNNSLQIANGLIPYKDINILTTPLFHFIVSIFLFIFGKNIFVYAAVLSIFKIIHLYVISKIAYIVCNKDKIKDSYQYFIISFLIGLFLFFDMYYEYNFLSLFFVSLITYIELLKKKERKYNILIGFLAALSFLSKQSIGIFTIIFVLIKPFIFKEKNKALLYRLLGVLIPYIIFIVYLIITNSFDDFVSYTILGLSSFSNNLSFFKSVTSDAEFSISFFIKSYFFLSIFLILFGYQLYLLYKKKYDTNKKIILFYSLVSISCFYPIRDYHHLLPILFTFLPLFIISLSNNKILDKISNYKLLIVFLFITICLTPMNMYINIYKDNSKKYEILKNDYNSINGLVVDKKIKKDIDTIIEYEKENDRKGIKTLILNQSSVIFHLAQNKYYKNYDLFMKGNFGYNGEEKMIEEIKKSKDTIYLIVVQDQFRNNDYIQLPDKVFDYVINNLTPIDEVLYYFVYSK